MIETGLILSIVVGVSELLKKYGMRKELIPLINIIFSIIANLAVSGISSESIIYGMIMGLVASGLYDQSKIFRLFEKNKNYEEMISMTNTAITKETAEFMATKEYQKQLAFAYDEEARGYDDSCPNEENEKEEV